MLIDPHPTGIAQITLDPYHSAHYQFASDSAWDHLSATPKLKASLAYADAVCFGTLALRSPPSRHAISELLGTTRTNALRVLDLNLRPPYNQKRTIVYALQLANVLKVNEAELLILSSFLNLEGSERKILQSLAEAFALQAIALTKGSDGFALFRGGEYHAIGHSPKITVVDTVGAGDSFTAALIEGLLRGDSLSRIGYNASRLAAYVCTQRGATPQIPHEFLETVL